VTFDAAGGAVAPASRTVLNGFAYGTLPAPTRTGHTFGGWWTGENGTGTEVTADTVVATTANHTLYAKWTASVSSTPGTVVLAAASDTGVSATDGLTRLNNHTPAAVLSFVVSGTVAGAEVRLYADGTLIGSAAADRTTTMVQTDGTTTLTDGAHAVTATQTEAGKFESAASPALTVTIDTVAPALLTAVSRKTHGAAGTFDLALPIASPWGDEGRKNGPTDLRFGFSEAVLPGASFAVTPSAGTATVTGTALLGTELAVSLSGATDVQWVRLAIQGVEDRAGNSVTAEFRVGYLFGDINQDRVVNIVDAVMVKAKYNLPITTDSNFVYDIDCTGAVNIIDVVLNKAAYNHRLPAP